MSFLIIVAVTTNIALSAVLTCDTDPCVIKPAGNDIVICTNETESCHIDCSMPHQCSKKNGTGIRIYTGSENTFIQCNSDYSCFGANIYVGEPNNNIGNVYTFGGKKNNFMIDCNANHACFETYINVNGYFSNGISIHALGKNSFKNGLLECSMSNQNQLCALNCGQSIDTENSCDRSSFFCYNGDCDCYGSSCPTVVAFTAKPTSQSPTEITMNPVVSPTNNPTPTTVNPTKLPSISPVIPPTNNPTLNPITPATLLWTPNSEQTVVCDYTVDICAINCDKLEQCVGMKVFSAAEYTIINCKNIQTCDLAKITVGVPEEAPIGYTINDFKNDNMRSVIIDCNHDHSCNSVNVHVNGNIKDGLHISALGISAIDGSNFHCELKPNQKCFLECGPSYLESCIFSSMLCTGGECICTGDTCPQTIFTRTQDPTKQTSIPTIKPTSVTNSPSKTPSIRPTKPTLYPTTSTPTVTPTNIPTPNTINPTINPTSIPTIVTLYPTPKPTSKPTDIITKTFSPDGSSLIICTNEVHTCMVNCFGYQQCKPAGDEVLTIYSAAKHTIVNCNNRDSCPDMVAYIGIPSILPPKTTVEDFLGEFNSVRIDCGYISSCKGVEIHIKGNFTEGVTINAGSVESFADSFLKCHLGNKQECRLNCGKDNDRSCVGSEFVCYGGVCGCVGETCPKVEHETPVPNIPGFFACEPRSETNECIDSKIYQGSGLLDCPWGYSCCACDEVICTNCEEVNCGSTYSCAGVNLTISGNLQTGAGLTCGDNYSCMYSRIIGENINRISCAGDASCQFTIMELNLNSKKLLAVEPLEIPCNGDESCQNTFIKAKNLRHINCNGDVSCSNTTFIFECHSTNVNIGCSLICNGDNACQFSNWDITNVDRVQCTGDDTCQYGNYNIKCLMIGCPVICTGPRACKHGNFRIQNIIGFDCSSVDACTYGVYNLDSIKPGPIYCDDLHACYGASINMNLVTSLSCNRHFSCTESKINIDCETIEGCPVSCGMYGCQNSFINIKNDVTLLNCWDDMACENSTINVNCKSDDPCPLVCAKHGCQNSNINIKSNLKSLDCYGQLSCENSTINAECSNKDCDGGCDVQCGIHGCEKSNITLLNSVKHVNCSNIFACSNSNINVETSHNNFGVYCDTWGCQDLKLNIFIKDNTCDINKQPEIKKILCDNTESCTNAIITINNNNRNTVLNVKNITCNGIQSCLGTTIHTIGNINIENIYCNPKSECNNIVICDPTNNCPTQSPSSLPTTITVNPTPHPPTYPTYNPTQYPTPLTKNPVNIIIGTNTAINIDNSNTVVFSIIFTFIFILICANLLYFCRKYKWYKKINNYNGDHMELKPIKEEQNNNNNNNNFINSYKPQKIISLKKQKSKKDMNMNLINKVKMHTPKIQHKRAKSGNIITGDDLNDNTNDGMLDDKEYLNLYYDTFNAGNNNEIDIDDNDINLLEDINNMDTTN